MKVHSFTLCKDDRFKVTGILANGKRFKPIYTDNYYYACSINLYKGSVWLIRNGQKILIERVTQ